MRLWAKLGANSKVLEGVAGDIPYGIAGLVSVLANGDPPAQRGLDHVDEVPAT